MGKYVTKDERKTCWKLLREHLLKIYLKKKQYVIKMLKKAKSITDEKVKTKRINKFSRILEKNKKITKEVIDNCVFNILKTKFDVRFDDKLVQDLYKEKKLSVEDVKKFKEKEELSQHWFGQMEGKKDKSLNDMISKIEGHLKIWKIKEEKRRIKREKKKQNWVDKKKQNTDNEGLNKNILKTNDLAKQDSKNKNEDNQMQNEENDIIEESSDESDDEVKIEFEENSDEQKKEEKNFQETNIIKEETNNTQEEQNKNNKTRKTEKKISEKEMMDKRRKNQFTTDFIYERERQEKKEKSSRLVDKFFLTEEELKETEINEKKREFVLGKKKSREFRLTSFDPTKMRQNKRQRRPKQGFKPQQKRSFGQERKPGTKFIKKNISKKNNQFKPKQGNTNKFANHPSYELKMQKRKREREGKFEGKIIDL